MHEGYDTKADDLENLQVEAAVEQLGKVVIGSQEGDERHQKVVIDCGYQNPWSNVKSNHHSPQVTAGTDASHSTN